MKRHWLRGMLLGVSLALFLAGGVALAQDVTPSNGWDEATMPEIPAEVFYTDTDNENNALTGNPDDDMGLGPDHYICHEDANHPVEFRILSPGGEANLIIAAWDVDEENGAPWDEEVRVYFNGTYIGDLTVGPDETWAVSVFPVVATGNDLVRATMQQEGSCFGIPWGALEIEIIEPEFVPEPGTIMLLGSGLMGLAGYATLRWRARE